MLFASIIQIQRQDVKRCKSHYYTAMIEDLSWFGIKWNCGPSSEDFLIDINKTDKVKELSGNRVLGKKQRKKSKNGNNPEQMITDIDEKDLLIEITDKSQPEIGDVSLQGERNLSEGRQGTFVVDNACKVRISTASSIYVNNNINENNETENKIQTEEEIDRTMGLLIEENLLTEKKSLKSLQTNAKEKMIEIEDENVAEKNNDNFLFGVNLGLLQRTYCQSKRIPLYIAAWNFLLKKKLSKI